MFSLPYTILLSSAGLTALQNQALLVALPFMYFYNPMFVREPRDAEEGGSSATSIQMDPSTRKGE